MEGQRRENHRILSFLFPLRLVIPLCFANVILYVHGSPRAAYRLRAKKVYCWAINIEISKPFLGSLLLPSRSSSVYVDTLSTRGEFENLLNAYEIGSD
jgi:hypothetical protein